VLSLCFVSSCLAGRPFVAPVGKLRYNAEQSPVLWRRNAAKTRTDGGGHRLVGRRNQILNVRTVIGMCGRDRELCHAFVVGIASAG
jgi:hypothetical protein